VRQPSLDDVFFSLTGGHIEEDDGIGTVDGSIHQGSGAEASTAGPLPGPDSEEGGGHREQEEARR
jgi:hypothetical protein